MQSASPEAPNRPRNPGSKSGAVSHSLGISSLVLGVVALFFSLIPCLGALSLPLSSLGLLLGILGAVVAVSRSGHGIGYPVAGLALSLMALLLGLFWLVLLDGASHGIEDTHGRSKGANQTREQNTSTEKDQPVKNDQGKQQAHEKEEAARREQEELQDRAQKEREKKQKEKARNEQERKERWEKERDNYFVWEEKLCTKPAQCEVLGITDFRAFLILSRTRMIVEAKSAGKDVLLELSDVNTVDVVPGKRYRFDNVQVITLRRDVRDFALGYRTVWVTMPAKAMSRVPTYEEFFILHVVNYPFPKIE
jgi:hypothetical protein